MLNRVAFLRTPSNVLFSIVACTFLTEALGLSEMTEMRRSKCMTDSKTREIENIFRLPAQQCCMKIYPGHHPVE